MIFKTLGIISQKQEFKMGIMRNDNLLTKFGPEARTRAILPNWRLRSYTVGNEKCVLGRKSDNYFVSNAFD